MSIEHEQVTRQFTQAVQCLVDESGPIKERLLIAYVSQLSQLDPQTDIPEAIASDFRTVRMRLSQDEVVGDKGNAASLIEEMTQREASEIADSIFSIFLRLHNLQ